MWVFYFNNLIKTKKKILNKPSIWCLNEVCKWQTKQPKIAKHWSRVNPTPMEVGLGVMQSFLFCCWAKRRESKRIDFRYWFFNCPLKFFLLDQMVFLMHFQSNQTRCWVAFVWDLKLIVWRRNLFWSELLFRGKKKKKKNQRIIHSQSFDWKL